MRGYKIFSFLSFVFVGKMDKLKVEKLIYLVEKKKKRKENIVCINLLSCSY